MLDLAGLAIHHPRVALLHLFGPAVIFRLGTDPTPVASGTMQRALGVAHLPRSGGEPLELSRMVDWATVPPSIVDASRLLPFTANAGDITEWAAIGIMAMLAHDLEAGEVRTVLPIGTGADYLIEISSQGYRVEVSGIHTDSDQHETTTRIGKKGRQLLGHHPEGFVSVTTFSYGPRQTVHSRFRFVRQASVTEPGSGEAIP